MDLIGAFEKLNSAFLKIGTRSKNSIQIQEVLNKMESGEFFRLPCSEQRTELNHFLELFLGRGNAHWILEDKGGIHPEFWLDFKAAVCSYLEKIDDERRWP